MKSNYLPYIAFNILQGFTCDLKLPLLLQVYISTRVTSYTYVHAHYHFRHMHHNCCIIFLVEGTGDDNCCTLKASMQIEWLGVLYCAIHLDCFNDSYDYPSLKCILLNSIG